MKKEKKNNKSGFGNISRCNADWCNDVCAVQGICGGNLL